MGIFRKLSFPLHIDSDWTDYTDQDIIDYKGSILSYVAKVFSELKLAKALQLYLRIIES